MELSTLCRVCMKTIFVDCIELDSPLNDKTYLECFNYCTKLNVFLQDALPRKICISCGRSLKIAYEFVKSAHEADNFLRENFILTRDSAKHLDGIKHEHPYFVESLEEEVDIDQQLKEETVCYEGEHKAIQPRFEIIFEAEVPKDRIEDNDLNLSLNEKDILSVDGLTIRKAQTNKTGSQVCRLCGEVFENRINLNQHKLAEHRGKHVGLCITCGQSFSDENCLKKHTALEHFPSACQYCKKKISIIGLKRHIRTVHGDVLPTAEKNEFTCEYCSKFFSSDKKLKDHLNTHTGKRPYVCEACGSSYHTEWNLRYHKKTMHDTQYEYAEPRKCQKCDFSTTNRLLWIKHGRRHDKPKQNIQKYLCASCPKKFLFPKLLEQHEIFAHGDKNVGPQCKVCNKIYRNYDCLKSHMMVHSEERPFECKECPKTFKYMTSLHTHEKLHKGKQVECPHCDKKVLSPRDLKIHLRTHTGERPFECHLCDRKFAVKVRLTDHLKRHHVGVLHK